MKVVKISETDTFENAHNVEAKKNLQHPKLGSNSYGFKRWTIA
jgi:hypothetical protein